MKKLTTLLLAATLVGPVGATVSRADYADLQAQVETKADVWLGGYLNSNDSSTNTSYADVQSPALPEAPSRLPSKKAYEYYAPDSSASGGFLFKGAPLPNRYHLEFDFYSNDDFFGDLRYSFKDYLQIRILPRRFFHNLDNTKLYDFDPTTTGSEVEIKDAQVDDYGLRVDIDEFFLRLKTPNFPLHLYGVGEVVKREGSRQERFLGGSAFFVGGRGRVRVSEARDIDQEKREIGIGTNAHLGIVEVDLSHRNRKFESNVAAPRYAYDFSAPVELKHNVVPELEAKTNTVKVHTTHTGRLFASATYSEINKSNESSGAEADNKMGYGEVFWQPLAYLSFSAKYRSQKNEASAPATVTDRNLVYAVVPGVESKTDLASLGMRYRLIPKTNISLEYTNQVKKVEDESALNWGRPPKQTRNIYELGFTNWAFTKVRVTGKYRHTNIDTDLGNEALIEPVNNDPDHKDFYNLGLTWLISPRITSFINATVTQDDTSHNRMFGGIRDAENGKAMNEHYLASLSFALSEKLTMTQTYTYLSWKQERDLVWENGLGAETVDSGYRNHQKAQNFALSFMYLPIKWLSFNGTVDYTVSDGRYEPTSPIDLGTFLFTADEAAQFAATSSEEINARLDTDVTLGRGWGLGLALRYTDWHDASYDNPSDGTFTGGLLKVTKKFIY